MNARCFGALALALSTAAACSESNPGKDVSTVEAVSFSAGDTASKNLAAELSFRHLHARKAELMEGVDEVQTKSVDIDLLGMAHTRVEQTIDGIPVVGGQAIIHLDPTGKLARVTDSLIRHIDVDTEPVFDRKSSIDIALEAFGDAGSLTEDPEASLAILRHEGADHLAWRIQLRRLDGTAQSTMPLYYIDAHTGAMLLHYDNLHTNLHTQNADDGLDDGEKETRDMENGTNYLQATQAEPSDRIASDAHENAGHALAFFRDRYDRNSYDDKGTQVRSYVHYGSDYVNAFWDGQRLTYGDGDGRVSGPLTVLDVVAHEFTHAVTHNTAELIYRGESGALNEATSDIMAAAIEVKANGGTVDQDTWKIGEDCWRASEALRFMNDPSRDGASRDHYQTRYRGSSDNGGVHLNSGIGNLFFYLLAAGGEHPKAKHRVAPVSGIGIDDAADIWYRALSVYMTPRTDFAAARTATLAAASDLFGASSDEHCQVQNAWAEVGVGSPCSSAAPPSDPPANGDQNLRNAVPNTGLSGGAGQMNLFTLDVPQGARDMVIRTSGGTGDVDLYVRYGNEPTTTRFDCRPYRWGNEEACAASAPPAGTWYVGLHAYDRFSGVTLTASYSR